MKRWIKTPGIWILLWTAIFLAAGVYHVRGQTAFTLSIDPLYTEVPLGNDFVLELVIEEGVDLNAFDVTVVYDSDILELANWAHGDYFSNLTTMTVVSQPGSLRVAATQVASSPVSGDGTILVMTYKAKGQGYSFIDITQAEFADDEGNKDEPEVVNGQVTVTLEPSYTPTVTRTPTLTWTPTATVTRTATNTPQPTRTPTAGGTPTSTRTGTVAFTQTPTSAISETPTALTGTALTRTAVGTALTGTLTPSITRTPWPVLEVTGTNTPEISVMPTNDTVEPVPTPDQQDHDSRSLLNGLLWAVLIAGLIAFAVLVVLILRRRKQKEEDLLL